MTGIAELVAENVEIWTGAIQSKSGAGRGGGKRISLYGIERLRALILDLAVRGKLIPQDGGDEPADELFKRICLSKTKDLPKGRFSIPSTWVWAKFGQIARFTPGRTPSRKDSRFWGGSTPWVSIADMRDGEILSATAECISDLATNSVFRGDPSPVGSILMSFKLTIGKVARLAIPAYHNEAIITVSPSIEELDPFLFIFLPVSARAGVSRNAIKGATLNSHSIYEITIPLPPLAEQRRIVAKVDELMALCDALERESTDAMAAHQTLVEVLLATLVNSTGAADLARQWARLEMHFDTLFTTDASIDALKQAILDLAVCGKLSSNTAVNWTPTELGAFVKDSAAGWSPKCIETPRSGTDWGVLKVSAVTWGRFQPTENKQLPPLLEPRPDIEVRPGDFLISRANTADLVARSVVVPEGAPAKLMMSDKIIRFRFNDKIDSEWVNLFHASTAARAYYARVAGGTSSSMKNVSQAQIRAAQLPVPPLAEQRRIVTRVDALMALCDSLKSRLADANQTQRYLADAIIEKAAA